MPELSFDRLFQCNAENDKSTNLQLGVYMGYASLTVFSNSKIIAKFPWHRSFLTLLRRGLSKIIDGKPGEKIHYPITKYDFENKKFTPLGSLFVGKDDKAIIFLGVAVPNHASMKFLLRTPMSFDLSEPMSDAVRSEIAAATLVDQLALDFPLAMALTSFKREAGTQRTGGNTGGNRTEDSNIFG